MIDEKNTQILPYNIYKNAGYSDTDIQKFLKPALKTAGYTDTEIGQYFLNNSNDASLSYLGIEKNKNIQDIGKFIADEQYKASLEGKNLNTIDAIKLGWSQSISGMLSRKTMPIEISKEELETLNFFERAIMGATSVVSDLPEYIIAGKVGAAAGAVAGSMVPAVGTAIGAAVGGSVAAFGGHAAARQMLIDMYSRGEISSFDELMFRIENSAKEFAKGSAVGLATAGASALGQIGKTALMGSTMARAQTVTGNIVNITAKSMPYGSEVLGLTTAGSLVEGHVPTAKDFIDSSILIAGLKGFDKITTQGKNAVKNKTIDYMYKKFVKDGTSPMQVVKEVQENPNKLVDIIKEKESIPKKQTISINETDQEVLAKTYPGYTPIPRPKGRTVLPKDEEINISKALKKQDIFNALADAVAIPVRIGKIDHKRAIGTYKQKSEVIRIRNAKDITTVAHEIGHHYEKLTFGKTASNEIAQYYDELSTFATKPVGIPNHNKIAAEGFAEFISKYVVNPEQAKELAPKFYDVFKNDIAPKAPKLHDALLKAREAVKKYYAQPLAYEVLGNISNPISEKLTTSEKWGQIKNNFIKNWLDDKNPIKQAVTSLEKNANVKLNFSNNAYYIARMFPGWTGKAETFLEHAPFDFNTLKDIPNVKSLKNIITSIKNWDEFTAYLVSARTLELNSRGIKTGIDIFSAKATERQLKTKYSKIAEDLYNYQDALLQYQKNSGLLSEKDYDTIKKQNKKYVPFYRVLDTQGTKVLSTKTLASKQTIKAIKGSTRDIINPLESIVKNTFEMINAAERNRVGLAYSNLSKLDKAGIYVERIPLNKNNITVSKGKTDINKKAYTYLLDSTKVGKDEILVYEDGKPALFKVDPDVAAVINGTNSSIQKIEALSFFRFFTKTLRAGATGLNLAFAAKNIIRDNLFAYLSSTTGYKPFMSSLENAKIAIKKDEAYWELKKAGGAQSSFVSIDRDVLQKKLSDFKETNYFEAVWNRLKEVKNELGDGNYSESIKKFGEAIDRVLDLPALISETSELSTRIGEFRNSLEGKELTKENIEKAGYNSREVTLDFAKGGIYGKTINQFKAFFNANILGIEKTVNILSNKKSAAKVIWAMGTLGILTALANYDFKNNQEDQDIKEVLPVQKDANWVLKVWGTGTIIRIPKPQQIGFISTLFEQLVTDTLNTMNKSEKEDIIKNLFTSFMRETNLPTTWKDVAQTISPTATMPIFENYANKSMYFGTPIVPAYTENALPEYQYTDRTSELTKAISKQLGVFIGKDHTFSPAKIENIVNGWTGGVGNYILSIVDLSARKVGIVPDPPKPSDTLVDIPFVRAFTLRHPSSGSASIQKWQEEYNKRKQYSISSDIDIKKFNDPKELSKYQAYKQLNSIQTSINQTTIQIRTIYVMPNLSAAEKRQTIDALYLTRIQIAKQGLQIIKDIDKSIKGPEK